MSSSGSTPCIAAIDFYLVLFICHQSQMLVLVHVPTRPCHRTIIICMQRDDEASRFKSRIVLVTGCVILYVRFHLYLYLGKSHEEPAK